MADALSEHASDRCRLRLVIGAVSVCLKRGAELGDGVGFRGPPDGGVVLDSDNAVQQKSGHDQVLAA